MHPIIILFVGFTIPSLFTVLFTFLKNSKFVFHFILLEIWYFWAMRVRNKHRVFSFHTICCLVGIVFYVLHSSFFQQYRLQLPNRLQPWPSTYNHHSETGSYSHSPIWPSKSNRSLEQEPMNNDRDGWSRSSLGGMLAFLVQM